MSEPIARRRTALLAVFALAALTVPLLFWVPPDPDQFLTALGFGAEIPLSGWVTAALVVLTYTVYTMWAVPEIRPIVTEFSWFRAIAIPLALLSGVVEEYFFRMLVMDTFAGVGMPVVLQVLVSALIFASAHIVWVLFSRSWRAVMPILFSTTGLGVLLGLVYLFSDRIVLPAVIAHIAINLVIEPGLLLNAAKQAGRSPSDAPPPDNT